MPNGSRSRRLLRIRILSVDDHPLLREGIAAIINEQIVGIFTRMAALLSGMMLPVFALAMTFALGIKAPLDFSVFSASAGALLLSTFG